MCVKLTKLDTKVPICEVTHINNNKVIHQQYVSISNVNRMPVYQHKINFMTHNKFLMIIKIETN